jgi:hypothetical protein
MSVVHPPPKSPWWRVVDWRLVAACGLPVWAFFLGLVVSRPLEAAGEIVPPSSALPEPPEEIPMPRAIVVREPETVVVTVPVVVPVPGDTVVVEAAAPAAPELKLPDTEVLPADRCKQHGTKVRFHPGTVEAAAEAKAAKKMMMVLHISGNFEDPGFT